MSSIIVRCNRDLHPFARLHGPAADQLPVRPPEDFDFCGRGAGELRAFSVCLERGSITTNEELVSEIQRGRSDLYGTLWENVKSFIAYKALHRYEYVQDRGGVDLEDLIQAGFLGLVAAVESFDPAGGYSFLTGLSKHLKTAFNVACGVRYERLAKDPIHRALSLDAPVDEDDPEGATLGDLQPSVDDVAGAVEERVYSEQLREAIENLLSRLSPTAADVIRATYFDGEAVEHIAERYGTSVKNLASRRTNYLGTLRVAARSTSEGAALRKFVDERTNFYYHVGPTTFQNTHESAPEHLTITRDWLERHYMR